MTVSDIYASLSEVDIPFLSQLRYQLRNLPKESQCALFCRAILKKINNEEKSIQEGETIHELLAQVRLKLEGKKNFANKSLVEYLDECMRRLNNESVRDQVPISGPEISDETIEVPLIEKPLSDSKATKALDELRAKYEVLENKLAVESGKFTEMFAKHEAVLNGYKLSKAQLASSRIKLGQIESENKLLKRKFDDELVNGERMKNEIERLKLELKESDELRKRNDIIHEQVEDQLAIELRRATEAKSEQDDKVAQLSSLIESNKQNLANCWSERATIVRDSSEAKRKCDQQVIGLSELVDKYKTSMLQSEREKEEAAKKALESSNSCSKLRHELDLTRAKVKYYESYFKQYQGVQLSPFHYPGWRF